VFESYLGAPQTPVVAGQHTVDADYFRRIDALNFAMAHDDGQLPQDLNTADIIILGISRTSKTPTSIYLAQRGYKTANLPLVPGIEPPVALAQPHRAFVVGLVASPDRIAEIRRNRVQMLADRNLDEYVDRTQISNELTYSRRLCARHGSRIGKRCNHRHGCVLLRLGTIMHGLPRDGQRRASRLGKVATRVGNSPFDRDLTDRDGGDATSDMKDDR